MNINTTYFNYKDRSFFINFSSVIARDLIDNVEKHSSSLTNKHDIVAIKLDNRIFGLEEEILLSGAEKTYNLDFVFSFSTEGINIIRQTACYIFAQAISEIHVDVKLGEYKITDYGFYYDFLCKSTVSKNDFKDIENKMQYVAKQKIDFESIDIEKEEAVDMFQKLHQVYKVELLKDEAPSSSIVPIVKKNNFMDIRSSKALYISKQVKYFKALSIAGAYWKDVSDNVMMQRMHFSVWHDKASLAEYSTMLKEAEQRDHRRLGSELNLFHFQEEAPGMPFWHPNGMKLLLTLQNYIRSKQNKYGYEEVQTPIMCADELWSKSGHIEKFKDDMFFIENDKKTYALKPMNCPCHIEIFNMGTKSYKDLPIRLAEFGRCHRNEASGALHGLMRARSLLIDDAHIFCTKQHIVEESLAFFDMVQEIYKELGFADVSVILSTRPEKRIGDDKLWDKAEQDLLNVIKKANTPYEICEGDGAFYGPKIEFHLKDKLNRTWQCGTLQLDFILASKLNAYYIDEAGKKKHPIILHRAALGTFERFIGILIEHYNGKFPIWLSPVQIAVATVTSDALEYAKKIVQKLKNNNIRAELEGKNDTINYKIKKLNKEKIPLIGIIGKQECVNNNISLRIRGSGEVNAKYTIDELVAYIISQNISDVGS